MLLLSYVHGHMVAVSTIAINIILIFTSGEATIEVIEGHTLTAIIIPKYVVTCTACFQISINTHGF